MNNDYNRLITKTNNLKNVYRPEILDISTTADKKRFDELIGSDNVFLHDEIEGQLKELMKIRNPKARIKPEEYPNLIQNYLNGKDIFSYGLWVYYPWLDKIVHVLPREEFIDLRTAANRNKITTAERDILADKKIGIIGLSVGQSVALTIAMERSCGEIRLADFDTLELNNLNRLRAGLHNLGLRKAYVVAREIAEIDPFLNTVCYTEGITEENIHGFFTDMGKLDVVIDECDGVDIKILCRIKAKELHVPVVMEASDKGTLDVERFDLHPERPIMHGWLEHLEIDFNVLKKLKTSEEKLPYILPISGLDTLSARMKASMIEIEETITTWPQLASAVALGGAVTADTCRRILLNYFTDSGRYFIDLEKLIAEPKSEMPFMPAYSSSEISINDMKRMAKEAGISVKGEGHVDTGIVKELVGSAIKAPSAGNNQPWKWYYENGVVFLFHDKYRSVSFGDFEDMASYTALGAAIENFELEADNRNIGTRVHYLPVPGNRQLVAAIELITNTEPTNLFRPEALVKYTDVRATNRNIGTRTSLPQSTYSALQDAVASVPGAQLILKTDAEELTALGSIIGSAERLRLMHPEGHYEFYEKELRWDPQQSKETADGIDLSTVDVSPSEIVGLKLVKDPSVIKLLTEWRGGRSLERIAKKSVAASSAIGLITMPDFSPLSHILGGRAVERMWLTATEQSIAIQPMLACILHFARLNYGNGIDMPAFMKEEFATLYQDFEQIFPNSDKHADVFLFRMAVAPEPKVKSFRVPVEKVLFSH